MGGDQSSSAYVHTVPATSPGFSEDERVGGIRYRGNKGSRHGHSEQKQGDELLAAGWATWGVQRISSKKWPIFSSEVILQASISKYILADFSQERLITEPQANATNFISGKESGSSCM